ncbi:MAG: hypothetical protein R3D62_11150 [Xanthobacteraceae bacterium]
MTPSRHHARPAVALKRRLGFRALMFAVLAALFGLAPAAQAEDRGRGSDRGRERETDRNRDRGADRGDDERRERSTGHDVDSDGEEDVGSNGKKSNKGKGE